MNNNRWINWRPISVREEIWPIMSHKFHSEKECHCVLQTGGKSHFGVVYIYISGILY